MVADAIAKYHLNQALINQFIVISVSRKVVDQVIDIVEAK